MAALTPDDYGQLRKYVYRFGSGKEELKADSASLPNEAKLLAAFQVFEDFWEANRVAVKTSLDAAIGFTTSNALAKKLAVAWLANKTMRGG